MTGFIAVFGWWLFLIVLILRKPITQLISTFTEKRLSVSNSEYVRRLEARIALLEEHVSMMGKEISEVKESSDFANKLLTTAGKNKVKV
jgi:hypothetical protein